MKLSKFKFELPEELIAKYPVEYRDESRLMVVHKEDGRIEHRQFKDILDYFEEDDVFVMNNTKVFPARLYGNKEKTGAQIEVFLLRELKSGGLLWDVLVDPARKIRIGNKLYFENEAGDELVAEVIDNTTSRGRTLRFLYDGEYDEFRAKLARLGSMPIPKYLGREVEESDIERYQTLFSKVEGAVAAPTAGLHFSREVLKRLEIKGVKLTELTLHVGLGTFRPVEVEDVTKHKMDSEEIEISEETANLVTQSIKDKHRICAVGTTVMRSIESSVGTEKSLKPFKGWSNKYIYPPYEFSIADSMITNFHLPGSTLLMMTTAFGGHEHIMNAYEVAVKEKYRFFSYGDAMLII